MAEEIDAAVIDQLIKLSRINCNDEERQALEKDLKRILKYVAQLHQVNTEHVSANPILEDLTNVFREDVTEIDLSRKDFLDNAPDQIGGMIKVPRFQTQ